MNDLKKEDGFVLVVVIGILTILSLMTVTFTTLSRIEIRATRNYTDSVKCEMVAKAGLEQALYVLRLDKFGTDTIAYNDDNGDENYDWTGETWMPGGGDFSGTDYDNDGDDTNESKWIYFPATTSSLDIRLPGKLRARYAVLITDDREAKININVSGDQPGDEGTSTTEIDMSSVITPDGNSIASKIISERTTMPFGVLTESEIVGIAGTSTAYTSRLEEIFESYTAAYEDHKGTLTAFSADTIVCPPYGTSTTMLNINALVNNEGAYTNTGTYDSDRKVEMIIDVLTAGGVPDVERQQMAVNIIDFIDTDDAVTKYPDSLIPTPVYYGVERTPYIYEVEANVDGTAGIYGKFIELFNPHDTPILNTGNWTIKFGATTIILPGLTIPAQGYYVVADDQQAYTGPSTGPPANRGYNYKNGDDADQYDASVNSLDDDGETLTLEDSNGVIVQVTYCGGTTNNKTMQLNDPRPIPLTASAADPWEWTSLNETAGEQNNNFDPSPAPPNQDDEWTSGTWFSSFLIANRRFSNKGYLGYIHRGSEWSSFKVDDSIAYPNVLKYITITDPSIDGIDNDGDGATDSLDTGSQADDFDGPEYRIPGLINVNTADIDVLESLPNIGASEASAIIGGRTFTSIGEVANVFTGISGDKWNREKPFRSISNLITTRSNVFTVYVTAQIWDELLSNKYAEKRIIAIVDRSVDPIKIRYFRWITE